MARNRPDLEFQIGGKMADFEKYYERARLPWVTRTSGGTVAAVERSHIESHPEHLILLKENDKIIGHIILARIEH